MEISSYIYILLQSNGIAIIPGFGIIRYFEHPASIDSNTGILRPPYAEINFQTEYDKDDNLLLEKIKLFEGISKEMAEEKLSIFVNLCNNNLSKDGYLIMENVGKFIKNTDGTINIEPDKKAPLFCKYEGLESIAPIIQEQTKAENRSNANIAEESEEVPDLDRKIISEPKEIIIQYEKKEVVSSSNDDEEINNQEDKELSDDEEINTSLKKNNIIKAIIYLLLSLSLGAFIVTYILNLYMFDKFIQKGVKYIGISPKLHAYFVDSSFIKQHKSDSLLKIQKSIDSINATYTDTSWKDTVKLPYPTKQISNNIETTANPSNPPKYYIISGCFRDLENAQKHIKLLINNGYQAVIAGKTGSGLIRVSYNNGTSTKKEALDLIKQIKDKEQTEPWLIQY